MSASALALVPAPALAPARAPASAAVTGRCKNELVLFNDDESMQHGLLLLLREGVFQR